MEAKRPAFWCSFISGDEIVGKSALCTVAGGLAGH